MINEDIYKLGAKMYYEAHGKYQNPYPIGSPEFNQFEQGWMQSLKRDDGHHSQSKFQSTSTSMRFSSNHKKSINADLYAELYRSRKG